MTDMQTLYTQVKTDMLKLRQNSEVTPLLVTLGGSRQFGYNAPDSDHDLHVIFDNRNAPTLFPTYENLEFTTLQGYNYDGVRIDKLLQGVANSNVTALDTFFGKNLIESPIFAYVEEAKTLIQENLNYYFILSAHRGMLNTDATNLGRMISANDTKRILKFSCGIIRNALSSMYYVKAIKEDRKMFCQHDLRVLMTRHRSAISDDVYQAMDLILTSRQKPDQSAKDSDLMYATVKLLSWAKDVFKDTSIEMSPPPDEETDKLQYSPRIALRRLMSQTDDFNEFVVNGTPNALQKQCQFLYSYIQRRLREL